MLKITSDMVCMLVPKSGIIPSMITVLKSFQNEVWIMLLITYIIIFSIYYARAAMNIDRFKLNGCSLGLEIYKMCIGTTTNRRFACFGLRILTAFCLIFTLVVLNAFQVTMMFLDIIIQCNFKQTSQYCNKFYLCKQIL